MKVLVACEFSGVVRDAFAHQGHDAWSCDLLPSETVTSNHIQGDVLDVVRCRSWDLLIAHPPCTHLASSGARYFKEKKKSRKQRQSLEFFLEMLNAPVPMRCIENPVGVVSSYICPPDQIIHPWQFGHPEEKTTCLWLRGLPPLRPTKVLKRRRNERWQNQTPSGQNNVPPSEHRWKIRSRTYHGIAEAMSLQWGGLTKPYRRGLGLNVPYHIHSYHDKE